MKKLLVVLVILLTAGMLFAEGEKESGTVKIAVVGPHSGDLASYGIPTIKAAELVAADYNANGGILGMQIELIIEDDVCKPEVAANSAAKVIGDGVVAVIGHICSGATKSALGIYGEVGIPVISSAATSPPLTQSGEYPNFFRTIASDDAQAELDAEFIASKLGLRTVAVLHDKQDYGKGFADFSVISLEKFGVEVVLYEGITVGAVDYSAVLNKVANSGAEGLVYGGYHPEASKLVQQMSQMGLDIPFISDDGVKDDTFISVAGEFAEGVYASGPMDTSSNPMSQEAVAAHKAKWDNEEPGAFFINAYAAAIALFEAIEAAGSTDGAAIMDALRANSVDTPLGSIRFDEKGDAIGVGFAVYQVQNGAYVEL
ncbi:MAG: branched chain amino acid ABC transporter substrate-binding protein [spirochete symbiont of Stewartia floridana]|nr:MAG: branched chain amino acid ABC transporter substrate-binding protein [spirochete symbiont of Stewartia floridana]